MTETRSGEQNDPHPQPAGEADEHPLSVLLFSWMRSDLFDRMFLAGLGALCAVLAALELVIHRHDGGGIDSLPVFQGVFGFLAFALAVLSGWPLGRLMRRPENYYRDQPDKDPDNTVEEEKEDGHDG
ncbi:MAG: hypothetical protein GC155_12020 [Alphaproteobacteria bacterium]|nr:hypothetical protein [Alphaproteobacteria bacterium]